MDRGGGHHQNYNKKSYMFLLAKSMCMFRLSDIIISDNGMQFANAIVTYFYRDLGVKIKFVFVIHPHQTDKRS